MRSSGNRSRTTHEISLAEAILPSPVSSPSTIAHSFSPLTRAAFIDRPNRFLVRCRLPDEEIVAHLPATGRLRELLVAGAEVWLTQQRAPHRKTDWDLTLIRGPSGLVCLDTRVPGRVVGKLLAAGAVPGIQAGAVRAEVTRGHSRLDFRVDGDPPTWVEVKSVTLVVDGVARFPDAPTERGRRHLEELAGAVAAGERGTVLFLVQRSDARGFAPNDATDPRFGSTLRRVAAAGVNIVAMTCQVSTDEIRVLGAIDVIL